MRDRSSRLAAFIHGLVLVAAACLGGCASLPPQDGRSPSSALPATGTRLGKAVEPGEAEHPGTSAVRTLASAHEAFGSRIALARVAERSIDAQYYIWDHDTTGLLLAQALWDAAARGVRVRMLIDDNNTSGQDAMLAALDAQPGIEVRLYNPFLQRNARLLGFASDFGRLNRRMHNKAFVADGALAVVGGRNIADAYFDAGDGTLFADFDVLLAGPVVAEVAAEFDRYWNSASAYPAAAILGPDARREDLGAALDANRAGQPARDYIDEVMRTPLARELEDGTVAFQWSPVTLIADDPAKTLDPSLSRDALLVAGLPRLLGKATRSFDIVSPYFVPGDAGAAWLASLAQQGIRVRVLTNALSATDVVAVHAGYARHRCTLLRAGVRLFELKRSSTPAEAPAHAHLGSSSHASLHAKLMAVDGERLFVGSFNFDARSAKLNTEMGVVVDNPGIAGLVDTVFREQAPKLAYEARIGADGHCPEWVERDAGGNEIVRRVEPESTAGQRFAVELLELLPIEWLL